MAEPTLRQPDAKPKQKWDVYRKISAWAGLLEAVAVIVIIFTLGSKLTGGPQAPETTWTIILLLCAPSILAGLISGSRYYALYAGYSERLDPTAQLSDEDAAKGNVAASSFIGDAIWGSLIAGIAGGIPATVGLSQLFGGIAVIFSPLFVVIIGIAWFAGWAIGAVASLIVSTSAGIAYGIGRSDRSKDRLPWIIVVAFLPILLLSVALPIAGVRFSGDGGGSFHAILAVGGFVPFDGEFIFGDILFWIARIAIWISIVLFVALVSIGTPALLTRKFEKQSPKVSAS